MAILSPYSPVTSVVELDLQGLDDAQRDKAKRIAGDIIVDGINDILDQSRSPVLGGAFKKQKADGERSILFEFGDMRDSLEWRDAGGNSIEIGSWDADETPKLFNHNTPKSSQNPLPQRQVLPLSNETFVDDIMDRVNGAIDELRETGRVRRVIPVEQFAVGDVEITPGTSRASVTTLGSVLDLDLDFDLFGD